MSKAQQLGSGPAFGAAATARSSRRDAIDSTLGAQAAATAAITDLPVPVISDNPDNPRNHLRNLDETVQTVREVGVLIPIVVSTVDAYLSARPDRADDLDEGSQYLVVDGHRRLEAARRAGLATIPVRVDNARVATDESLLEAAFIANYDRDDMTDLEEAHALQSLVDYYGSQTKASKRLGIPQNTISSKLSLLKLSPELQKDLVSGERKVEHVRNLGKLPHDEQKKKADERRSAVRQKPTQSANVPAQGTGGTPSRAQPEASEQVSRRDNPGPDSLEQGATDVDASEAPAEVSRRDNPGSVPTQEASGSSAAGTPEEVSRRDTSESEASADAAPLAELARHVAAVKEFALSIPGMAEAYRLAAEADQERADVLAAELREHMARAVQHLP
ncbi:ParB/RepB/Spo0J family partition protein [Streptomyces sp. BH097]|uniref:ParB/RepB/Spo0J family partition protein n=1 Tax=unclassified Streptomyces TaxID=2593676 RepID=UPI003BB70A39